MECRSCLSGVDHCHGTLVLHENGDVDCTEVCYDLGAVRHRLSISCAEIDGGCACVVVAGEYARAS